MFLRCHKGAANSIASGVWIAVLAFLPLNAVAQEVVDTSALSSLEELLNTEISSAMKYERRAADIPASVSIITADDIERYGFLTPLEAIATLSGFYSSYDRNYSYLGVRGFGRPTDYNNRIQVLVDGHTVNDAYFNSGYLGSEFPIAMDVIERIEVTRGPGSALYGNGAMFGMVNIVTKDVASLNGTIVRGGVGQFGEVRASGVIVRTLSAQTDLTVSGTWADVDGQNLYFPAYDALTSNYGVSERDDWERYHGLLGTLRHGGLRVQGLYSSRSKGIPTGAWGTIFNSDNAKTVDRHAFGEVGYQFRAANNASISSRLYYDHYFYIGDYPYEEVMNKDAAWTHSLGGDLQLTWDTGPNNRLVAGATHQQNLEARYKYWDEPAPVYYDGDNPYNTTSLYVQDEYQLLRNLSVTLGIRHDHNSIAPGSTTPRAGLVFHPFRTTTVKALYGKAFRTPSHYELFWDNSNIGFRGNPNLEPEQIRTTELVLEQLVGSFVTTSISAYQYRLGGLIDFVEDPLDGVQVYQNSGTVRTNGVEVGMQARLPRDVMMFANYSYQDAHGEDEEDLTNSPYHFATVGMSVPVRSALTLGALAHAESGRRTVYDTETASFFTVNLNVTYAPRFMRLRGAGGLDGKTSLQLRITNAFDAAYATPGGYEHLSDAIAQDGRNIRAMLKVQL